MGVIEVEFAGLTIKAHNELCEQFAQLQAENERLMEALKKYGEHKTSCKKLFINANDPTLNSFYKECTCGFEQALKGE